MARRLFSGGGLILLSSVILTACTPPPTQPPDVRPFQTQSMTSTSPDGHVVTVGNFNVVDDDGAGHVTVVGVGNTVHGGGQITEVGVGNRVITDGAPTTVQQVGDFNTVATTAGPIAGWLGPWSVGIPGL